MSNYTTKSIVGNGLDHHFNNSIAGLMILRRRSPNHPHLRKHEARSKERFISGLDHLIPSTEDDELRLRLEEMRETAEQGDFSNFQTLENLKAHYDSIKGEYA